MALTQNDAIEKALKLVGPRAYVDNVSGIKVIGQLVPDGNLPKKQILFQGRNWTEAIENMTKHYATIGQKISVDN